MSYFRRVVPQKITSTDKWRPCTLPITVSKSFKATHSTNTYHKNHSVIIILLSFVYQLNPKAGDDISIVLDFQYQYTSTAKYISIRNQHNSSKIFSSHPVGMSYWKKCWVCLNGYSLNHHVWLNKVSCDRITNACAVRCFFDMKYLTVSSVTNTEVNTYSRIFSHIPYKQKWLHGYLVA